MSKTFEHASRADAQSINPLYLCIVGGKRLPEDERGPLDTDWDPNHPLHAHDLLRPLDPVDVDDVFDQGVLVTIEVVRYNDPKTGKAIPMVHLGRGRVRKARKANIRRAKEGLPLIEIKFIVVRTANNLQLLSRAVAENLRRKTMGLLDQIELAKQLMLHGASKDTAAEKIGIPPAKLEKALTFEDNATPEVKEALRQGRLSTSAALVLMDIEDPTEQDKRLSELLSAPKPTVRRAREIATGKTDPTPRRPLQKRMFARVDKHTRGNEWMQGAKAALAWILDGTLHKDLARLIDSADEPAPAPAGKKKTS